MVPSLFQYEFMVRALIGGIIIGGTAPILGVFLVLRRFSLMADALSHVALMGVAIGFAVNLYPSITTLVTVVAAAIAIELLRSKGKLPGDVVLAVILYVTLAIAIVVISSVGAFNVDLLAFLFGSILTISSNDIWALMVMGLVVLVAVVFLFDELAQSSFDEDLARVSGVRVEWVNLGLAILAGIMIALSIRIVGALLIGSLLVIPVLVGQALANSLRATVFTAMLAGVLSTSLGLMVAFYVNVPAGGAIVILSAGLLAGAHLLRATKDHLFARRSARP